ncbi:MAG: adenylate/guanylate cyclase domain-containing protein [Flavobacteriales bacterium]
MLVHGGLDDTTLCRIHLNLAADYSTGRTDDAIEHVQLSIALAKKINLPLLLGKALNNYGIALKNQTRYADALGVLQRAVQIKDSIGDAAGAAQTMTVIGDLYYRQGQFDAALESAKHALHLLGDAPDPKVLAGIYNAYGDSYRGLAQLDSSIHYYNRGLKAAEEGGAAVAYGAATNGLGLNYFDKGEFAESAKYYEMSLELGRMLEREDAIAISMLNAGSAYGMMGATDKGVRYLKEAITRARGMKNMHVEYEGCKSLAEILGRAGRYEEAFAYQNTLQAIGDSIKQLENRKLVAEYQTKFETQQKEKEIEVLNLDKKVQAEALAKEQLRRNVLVGGLVVVLVFAIVFFFQRNRIKKGKRLSDELLLNILPEETANELKAKGSAEAKLFDEVTVLFTDFKDFTRVAEQLSPQALVAEIDHCFKAFDGIVGKYGIEKIKTIGDAYMAAGGLPVVNTTNAIDVVSAALDIQRFIVEYRSERQSRGQVGFDIRIGIHTGPVVAGIVGLKKFAYDIWGDTVNTASRMESSGEPGKVNISGTTYELVKDRFACVHRGKIQAKNKGEIDMYFVEGMR